jgi:predicted GTPase
MTQSVHYTRVTDFYNTSCLHNYCADQTLWYVLKVIKAATERLSYTLFLCSRMTLFIVCHTNANRATHGNEVFPQQNVITFALKHNTKDDF